MKKDIKIQEDGCLECFRLLMFQLGTTYPKSIFYRRLDLMTEKEREKYEGKISNLIDKIYEHLGDEIDNIDNIMANRAEIEKDEWKV